MPPAVSLLIPVWNEAEVLPTCLADVRAQVGIDFECVLALDGPSDGTRAIALAETAGDPRFVVLDLPHRGLVAALEAGLAACRAPLVARMDADDRMHPERLVRQARALATSEHALVTCEVAYDVIGDATPQGGMLRHVAWLNQLRTPAALRCARFIDAPVAHPAVMMRAAVVRAVGGYRHGDFAEDHDLWLRLFHAGHEFGFVDSDRGPLVTWRDRPRRATRTDRRYADEARRALVHRHLVAGPLAGGARPVRIWGAGPYGRWHGKHLRALGVVVDAFIDIDPKKIGRRVLGDVPVVDATSLGGPDERAILVAVASRGARALIAAELAARGHVEDRDWWALQ